MRKLISKHCRPLICTALLTFLLLGCSYKDPETHANIRIRNLSDYDLNKVVLSAGRQNGATHVTRYGPGHRVPFDENDFTIYQSIEPISANYGAIELRTNSHLHPYNHPTGHIHSPPGYPASRDPLEVGKYYTYEFDLAQDPKHEDRFDVIYFNIVEDPPPTI